MNPLRLLRAIGLFSVVVVAGSSAFAVTLNLISESRSVSVNGGGGGQSYSFAQSTTNSFGQFVGLAQGSAPGSSASAFQNSIISGSGVSLTGSLFEDADSALGGIYASANASSSLAVTFNVPTPAAFYMSAPTWYSSTIHGAISYTLSSSQGTTSLAISPYSPFVAPIIGTLQPGINYTLTATANDWKAGGYDNGGMRYELGFTLVPDAGETAAMLGLALVLIVVLARNGLLRRDAGRRGAGE